MANLLSYSRIFLAIIFVVLITKDQNVSALSVVVIAGATDYFDGFIARKTNTVTSFGALLDPIADRIFVVSVCVGILVRYYNEPLFKIAASLLLIRELIIALGFLVLKKKGIKTSVSYLGKISTAFVFISFVIVFLLPELGIYLLLAAILVYYASALDYAHKAWRKIVKEN